MHLQKQILLVFSTQPLKDLSHISFTIVSI